MCRLYGFHANKPTKVECELVYSQNALLLQSLGKEGGESHTDGWGIAYYQDHSAQIIKKAWAANHGELFKTTATSIRSHTVLAHVRNATVGKPALFNTHPFTHGSWSFIHNGCIDPFSAIQPIFMNEIDKEYRAAIKGTTDSEHIFYYLLSLHKRSANNDMLHTLKQGINQIVSWGNSLASKLNEISLNIIITDGSQLYGARYGRELFHIERSSVHICEVCGIAHIECVPDPKYRAFIVASEPITHENWQEIPEGVVFSVDSDNGFVSKSIVEQTG